MQASAATAAATPVATTPIMKMPEVDTPVVKVPEVKLKDMKKHRMETHGMDEQSELVQSVEKARNILSLNEEKVKPKLSFKEGYNSELWYVDTGASNHMSGCSRIFTELDFSVKGIVRFGDGSVVQICGRGTVLLSCPSGKQHVLKDVYFIPKLRSNIVSLGQLDEEGRKFELYKGQLNIRDHSGELLVEAQRTKKRLYALNLKKLVCLPLDANTVVMHGVGARPVTRTRTSTSKEPTSARESKSGDAACSVARVEPA
jgi:hypothetical protein